jgi:Headcase protein
MCFYLCIVLYVSGDFSNSLVQVCVSFVSVPRLVAASKGLFARRQDFSSFNILPRHKVNSYHIKVSAFALLERAYLNPRAR